MTLPNPCNMAWLESYYSTSLNRTVYELWAGFTDWETGTLSRTLMHTSYGSILEIALNSNGRRLACTEESGSAGYVRIWDSRTRDADLIELPISSNYLGDLGIDRDDVVHVKERFMNGGFYSIVTAHDVRYTANPWPPGINVSQSGFLRLDAAVYMGTDSSVNQRVIDYTPFLDDGWNFTGVTAGMPPYSSAFVSGTGLFTAYQRTIDYQRYTLPVINNRTGAQVYVSAPIQWRDGIGDLIAVFGGADDRYIYYGTPDVFPDQPLTQVHRENRQTGAVSSMVVDTGGDGPPRPIGEIVEGVVLCAGYSSYYVAAFDQDVVHKINVSRRISQATTLSSAPSLRPQFWTDHLGTEETM